MDKRFTYYVLVFLFEQYYTTFHLGNDACKFQLKSTLMVFKSEGIPSEIKVV